jgi:hypothetical protein
MQMYVYVLDFLAILLTVLKIAPEPAFHPSLTKINLDQISLKSNGSKESLTSLQRYLEQHIEPEIGDAKISPEPFLPSSMPGLDIDAAILPQSCEELRTPSLFSAKLSASSKGSLHSMGSHLSRKSYKSSASRGSRQGRRKHPYEGHNKVENDAKFACVFCKTPYKTLYEWRRHEESAHVVPVEYICEGLAMMTINNKCVYCGAGEHWWDNDDHQLHAIKHHQRCCAQKTMAERTFSRKDHLVQHSSGAQGFQILNERQKSNS